MTEILHLIYLYGLMAVVGVLLVGLVISCIAAYLVNRTETIPIDWRR